MTGITYDEFIEFISQNREIIFLYNDHRYVIQPEVSDNKCWLVIWTAEENIENICIARERTKSELCIDNDCIEKIINKRCFDDKSFFELKDRIHVEEIF